tara:strand:- start:996 stop:1340 length:345 start_codon:yes stop_codon:yes gene_type:complete
MSLTTECKKCGIAFRRMSLKSIDTVCGECRRRKNFKQTAKIVLPSEAQIAARLVAAEKSLAAMHTAVDVAIKMEITRRLEPINQTLDGLVQDNKQLRETIETLIQEIEDIHNHQ